MYTPATEREGSEEHSLFRPLNQQFDPLALLHLRKRLLRLVKLDLARNQLLDRDAPASHEINGGLVVARAVAERALDVELLGAHGHDGEGDVGLAHTALSRGQ
jgi:hypothetical protein